ncbi:MAG TPA: MBOAT family protein [Clostridiales bacterium]|nr:MBOAT family protein [Clostridiales bacterium]
MVFSSISFIYYFLPVVLVLYFLVPFKFKNIVLLISSLFFYIYGEPLYFILMALSILSGYLHGFWIERAKSGRYAKIPLISSIITSIGLLVIFKYADFFIGNINWIFKSNIPLLRIALPIGISFYTFQILSYTIDVYRGNAEVQRNFINFAMYVSLFPQLIAGPIVRYTTVEKEINKRSHSLDNFAYGVSRFIIGLSKKVLLANNLGELVSVLQNTREKTILSFWIAAIAFALQIYFDFSGYSDMAIGLGRMFGFHFLENFNYPFISKSLTEFWRRWHMSLGTWFRDYVYIPMGGNRVSAIKWIRNIIVVWFLTGFWHGAQWNFIVWGLYFAVMLAAEKYFIKKILSKLPSIAAHIYTLFFILLSFALFNSDGMGDSLNSLAGMFGLLDVPFSNDFTLYYLKSYGFTMLIAAAGSTPLIKTLFMKISNMDTLRKAVNIMEPVMLVLLLLLITGYLVDGSFNPFLYFRF